LKYKVELIPSAKKSLKNIELPYSKKILERIHLLELDPRHNGSIKLSGYENTYRTRVGKYRIVYEIYDKNVLVLVVNIDHRKDIYR
jgi:mRNA interferase RelE/StbE